jgi:hypothetical protein
VGRHALGEVLAQCATARNSFLQAEALAVLAAAFRAPTAAPLLAELRSAHGPAVAAALAAAATGPFKNKEQHAGALKAAIAAVEGVKRLQPAGQRLADALGPDALAAVAKAVVTVRALEEAPPAKVAAQLERLVAVMGVAALVDKAKPDAAKLSALRRARAAAAEGGKPKAAAVRVAAAAGSKPAKASPAAPKAPIANGAGAPAGGKLGRGGDAAAAAAALKGPKPEKKRPSEAAPPPAADAGGAKKARKQGDAHRS